MGMSWKKMDVQLREYSPLLRDDLGIEPPQSNHLATQIADEIAELPEDVLDTICSSDKISTTDRLEELKAFQAFMEFAAQSERPAIVRASVIINSYVCFVYLGDALFKQLKKRCPKWSAARKCCKFLTDNPVRAFRNAIAHANWTYKPDFSGLVFWACKGDAKDEAMKRFEVDERKLAFWQSLARCVAYVAYTEIEAR
jgi:hypothetical protein